MLISIVLLGLLSISFADDSCSLDDYEKIGCFKRNSRVFPDQLANNRDAASDHFIGKTIDWNNYKASLNKLACKCLNKVKEGGYKVFALGFYGECFAGKDESKFDEMVKDTNSVSSRCIRHTYKSCNHNDTELCIGIDSSEYVYKLPNKAPEKINGGFSEWEWDECSATCGEGFQEGQRQCNNPLPENGGADCDGEFTQTKACKVKECPVNGNFSEWSKFSECSLSCGGGSHERSRECNNPAPAYGGNECSGPSSEEQECNTNNCPVDSEVSEWSNWNSCSKTCGNGVQKRTRQCIKEQQYGGVPCPSKMEDSKSCFVKNCPVDSEVSNWSNWNTCSKTCGNGVQKRTRQCIKEQKHGGVPCPSKMEDSKSCFVKNCPVDSEVSNWSNWNTCSKTCGNGVQKRTRQCIKEQKHGGVPCPSKMEESKSCFVKNCPINGGVSSWSSWSSCSRTCGGGVNKRSRTCTNPRPQYDGENCKQPLSDQKSCGAEPCISDSSVKSKIRSLLNSYQSQSHSTFRYTLKNELTTTYPSYYFTVSVYNAISGYDNHAVKGYYVHTFREKNRNVVVTYVKKSSRFPSSSKRTEIKNGVLNAIKDKGRRAETSMDKAWNKAVSYGYDIASVHVVRFGNGLRTSYNGFVTFENFVCDKDCNIWGSCSNHQSSVVITYGKR